MLIGVLTTVTAKVHWLLLPLASRAVLVTVVVPTGKRKPLAGTLATLVTTQLSVAIIGIPAGMKVPTDMKQLTDLREKGKIAYFETRGRELVLYWRELAPKQKIELTVDLVCDVPGTYRGPASRAYLYYDADHKHWVEPLAAKIAPLTNEKADDKAAAK